MTEKTSQNVVSLEMDHPIWEHFFTVAPLVLVGTREPDGSYDLAPKHMATPLGWENYFGFVCTREHATYQNAQREEVFTVSYPRPSQVVVTSMAAAPRCEDDSKPSLRTLSTFEAATVDGVLVEEGYLFLECELDRIVDGFGPNSLIAGHVVDAHVSTEAMRISERTDQEVIHEMPLLAYLSPGRFASVDSSEAFPFHAGTTR